MKRRIMLSVALALVAISALLMRSDSGVEAQNQIRIIADTGSVPIGPDQELRLTMVSGNTTANGNFNFRVRQMGYEQGSCAGGVCKQTIASQSVSDLTTLMPGEAASIVVDPTNHNIAYVRGVVMSDSRDARVNALIIDKNTGQVDSVLIALINGLPGVN